MTGWIGVAGFSFCLRLQKQAQCRARGLVTTPWGHGGKARTGICISLTSGSSQGSAPLWATKVGEAAPLDRSPKPCGSGTDPHPPSFSGPQGDLLVTPPCVAPPRRMAVRSPVVGNLPHPGSPLLHPQRPPSSGVQGGQMWGISPPQGRGQACPALARHTVEGDVTALGGDHLEAHKSSL